MPNFGKMTKFIVMHYFFLVPQDADEAVKLAEEIGTIITIIHVHTYVHVCYLHMYVHVYMYLYVCTREP